MVEISSSKRKDQAMEKEFERTWTGLRTFYSLTHKLGLISVNPSFDTLSIRQLDIDIDGFFDRNLTQENLKLLRFNAVS